MEAFPSNSHKVTDKSKKVPKKERPELKKIVSGEVIKRKRPLGQRIKGVFFGGEFKDAVRYISRDVLLPAFKNLIVDATSKGVERVIYGETAPRRRPLDLGRPRFQYNQPVDRGYTPRSAMLPDQPPIAQSRRSIQPNEIVLQTRDDAEAVLEQLGNLIEKYEAASVADLNELLGLPSVYTDNNWGWTTLGFSGIQQVRDGYLLVLPPLEPVN